MFYLSRHSVQQGWPMRVSPQPVPGYHVEVSTRVLRFYEWLDQKTKMGTRRLLAQAIQASITASTQPQQASRRARRFIV